MWALISNFQAASGLLKRQIKKKAQAAISWVKHTETWDKINLLSGTQSSEGLGAAGPYFHSLPIQQEFGHVQQELSWWQIHE